VSDTGQPIIEVRNLSVGSIAKGRTLRKIVDDVTLSVPRRGIIGVAGESGCGKSTLLLAMMGSLKPGLQLLQGEVRLGELSLFQVPSRELGHIHGRRIALVPQNAGQALTPTLRIGAQIEEVLRLHTPLGADARTARIHELLERVRIANPEAIARRYPHEISGGQQQRAAIAMAMAGEPELLLMDEPTTGLDVTVKHHILSILRDLHASTQLSIVCVSHDIAVLADLAETVVVMYDGQIVEMQRTSELLRRPRHPYAFHLLRSVPSVRRSVIPPSIPGAPSALRPGGPACRFLDRCVCAMPLCRDTAPVLATSDGSHGLVRCHNPNSEALEESLSGLESTPKPVDERVVLSIADLVVSYAKPGALAFLRGSRFRQRPVIEGVNLRLRRGELLGIVGESGSGKSTMLRSVAGLWPILAGQMRLDESIDIGRVVTSRNRQELRRVQIIFQNPDASLNPRQRIGAILGKPLRLYFGMRGQPLENRVSELLASVRLDDSYKDRYPGQLSGGEKQRVAIARAFAAEPDIVLCDEITSALDISVQASVLRLIKELSVEHGTSSMFVTHDLGVVRALCDRVAVLFEGQICEYGEVATVCDAPQHAYTKRLLSAVS
jgi:peptide/nickel transport system ATP-binding protein